MPAKPCDPTKGDAPAAWTLQRHRIENPTNKVRNQHHEFCPNRRAL